MSVHNGAEKKKDESWDRAKGGHSGSITPSMGYGSFEFTVNEVG